MAGPPRADPTQRLVSLDALRGCDMFWIIGGERLVHEAAEISGHPSLAALSGPSR